MNQTVPRQLVDRYGRVHTYLRISVTDRCNLRCQYCMPQGKAVWKPKAELLSDNEIISLADLFAQYGTTKIRLTGGEPTARPAIETLVRRIAGIAGITTVAMTTNGTLLKEKAAELKAAGLSAVNISLDSLRRDRFARITGRDRVGDVLDGIKAALAAGLSPVRINTVVMKGINDDELSEFVEFASTHAVSVRFIEYMPSQTAGMEESLMVPAGEIKRKIEQQVRLVPVAADSSVANEYLINDGVGRVGFITPMTDHFCGHCNRLRITADGCLKTCLFYQGTFNLRSALRSGLPSAEIMYQVMNCLAGKIDFPPSADRILSGEERGMFTVGG